MNPAQYVFRVVVPAIHSVEGVEIIGEFDRTIDGDNGAQHLAIQKSVEYGEAIIRICDARMENKYKWIAREGMYLNGKFVR